MFSSQAVNRSGTVSLSTDECGWLLAAPSLIHGKPRNDPCEFNSLTLPNGCLLTLFLKELRAK